MTEQDFLRLLRFYLACIEAEDQHSLTKKLSALHRSLVSPWEQEEPYFHPEATEVVFETNSIPTQKVLRGGEAFAGSPERFVYGYPVFLDKDGFLSPLFVAEVEVEHREENCFAMRPVEAKDIQLNHHAFRRQNAKPEELRVLQDQLEGEYGSFADRLRAAFEALGGPILDLPPSPLDPYPKANSPRSQWVNRPILFKSERSAYTHHLRRELEAMAEYPRLFNDLGSTAAGVVAGIDAATSQSSTRQSPLSLLQVLPLNSGQENTALAALEAPLTVITGPPGTGKSQVVVDLLASCAVAGRPVLFASKNNKAVDVVRTRLRAILGEERDWTLRFGSRNVMDESRKEMDSRLNGLNPETVPPPPEPKILKQLYEEIGTVRRKIKKLEQSRKEYERLERDRLVAEGLVEEAWAESWPPDSPLPDLSRADKLMRIVDGRKCGKCGVRKCGVRSLYSLSCLHYLL